MQRERHLLKTYWIEVLGSIPRCFGVSAYSQQDALSLLSAAGYEIESRQIEVREGVTVADLDPNHVVPNMGVMPGVGCGSPT